MRKTKKYKRKRRKTRKRGGRFSIPIISAKSINNAKQIASKGMNQASQIASKGMNQSSQMVYDKMKNIENIFKTSYIQQFIEKIKGIKVKKEQIVEYMKVNLMNNDNMKVGNDETKKLIDFFNDNKDVIITIIKNEEFKIDILATGNENDIKYMILKILKYNPTILLKINTQALL